MEHMKDWLVKAAKQIQLDGVLYEPRVYFDTFTISAEQSASEIVKGSPNNIFVNGEQFPVSLQYITASLLPFFEGNIGSNPDPRLLQRIGMRVRYHDQYYMARTHAPLALWENTPNAAPDFVSPSTATWDFEQPFVLSARDSLQITVQCLLPVFFEGLGLTVSVSLHGIGLLSERPYFFSGKTTLTDTTSTNLPTTFFRNDGSEPVVIGGIVLNVFATGLDQLNTGVTVPASFINVQCRQIGNGTNADWVQGPSPVYSSQVPAVLLGAKTGFNMTHRIPGNGWQWRPGEGIEIDVNNLGLPPCARAQKTLLGAPAATPTEVEPAQQEDCFYRVGVALLGYIAVQ
jgi:hypothetical protein